MKIVKKIGVFIALLIGSAVLASENREQNELKRKPFLSSESKMARTVIIHLDINGTIMAADLVQGKTGKIAVTQEFAKKTVGVWHPGLPEMRYQDYVEQHVIPGLEADQSIKKQRRELYLNFMNMIQESQHPSLERIQQNYNNLIGILKQQQDPLYPSFWRLIDWAQRSSHDVRVIFRSFGKDIPEVIKLLEDKGHSLTNTFCYENGQLYRGYFEDTDFVKDKACHDLSQTFAHKFNAIKDDWKLWNNNQEQETYAKPFHYIEGVISMFFDDNAKEKQIIAPKGFTLHNGTSLKTEDLLNTGHIVAVSPLKAMIQPDYFVKKIEALLNITF